MSRESLSIQGGSYVSRKMSAARALAAFTLADLQDAPRLSKKAAKLKLLKMHRKPCVKHNFGSTGIATVCTRCGYTREKTHRVYKPMVGGSLSALDAKLAAL